MIISTLVLWASVLTLAMWSLAVITLLFIRLFDQWPPGGGAVA